MTRLAAVVLAAVLASPSLLPCRTDVTPGRAATAGDHDPGMGAPAGPIVSPVVVPAPVVLGGSPSVTPAAVAACRFAAGERVPVRAVRPAFVVKSAPPILRV
jgi:hypothetical protein